MLHLDDSVQFLKNVGEKRAQNYSKLNIYHVNDLLYHFPRHYIDLSSPYSIAEAPLEDSVPIKGVLISKSKEQHIRKGMSIFKLTVFDGNDELEITIFNARYLVAGLSVDKEYVFFGKIEGNLLHKKMNSPLIFPFNQSNKILSIYNQTAGIQSSLIRKNIKQCLEQLKPLDDPIPEAFRLKYNLDDINTCIKNIHFPPSIESAISARNRFVFEELLTLSCALYSLRADREKDRMMPLKKLSLSLFYKSLPYSPTSAQIRCINEAIADMMGGIPMNRLIQGDVGSGKTLVAAAAIYFVCKNSHQSALMAPTEILAEQHYNTLLNLLEPFNIRIALLTGSTKTAQRRETLKGLKNGNIDVCVGTHTLLSGSVDYNSLGLVITDEQHRFGVAQRATLSQKNKNSHVLVMSATPIPRTLSLIIYGDLSLSLLDEMPPGRQIIDTLLINDSKLERAMGFIKKNIDNGQQAYIVCPLIEQGEVDSGLKPAIEYSQYLSEGIFQNYNVGLLHGKMKSKDKESVMKKFKAGEIDLLVSTTVIEVGIDVPNATTMLIENAERFGLSQLHQLRGRVGRGKEKSYCILVSNAKGEIAKKRLFAMKEISDGFKLAEYDLTLRGPGDFFGYRQHGLPTLKVADLAENLDTMEQTQLCANSILLSDPNLIKKEHSALKQNVKKMIKAVGERPN